MASIRLKPLVQPTFRKRLGEVRVTVCVILTAVLLALLIFAVRSKRRVDGSNSLPLEKFSELSTEVTTPVNKLATPHILISLRIVPQVSQTKIITEYFLINPLDVPVNYTGFRRDSWDPMPPPGVVDPIYHLKTKKPDATAWVDIDTIIDCGTGLDTLAIQPMGAGRFKVVSDTALDNVRVGVGCTWKQQGVEVKETIWSPIIDSPNR